MARRKAKRSGRSRGVSVSLTDVGFGIALADTIGLIDAGDTLMRGGGLKDALSDVKSKAGDMSTYINIGITTAVYGLIKKVVPSRTLVSFGKFKIKV